jgi:hypothetical protein
VRNKPDNGLDLGLRFVAAWSQIAKGVEKKTSSGRGREMFGAGLNGQKTSHSCMYWCLRSKCASLGNVSVSISTFLGSLAKVCPKISGAKGMYWCVRVYRK